MTRLESTLFFVRQLAIRSAPLAVVAIVGAVVALGASSPLSPFLACLEGTLLLGVLAWRWRARLRATLPSAAKLAEAELALLGVFGVVAVAHRLDGSLDGPSYAAVWIVLLVTSVFAHVPAAVGAVVGLWVIETAVRSQGREIVSVPFVSHAVLALVFVSANHMLLRAEMLRLRVKAKTRVDAELNRLQEAARSYRLLGVTRTAAAAGGPSRLDDERLARSGVEEIHQAVHFSLELVRNSMGLQTALLLWLNDPGTHLRIVERSARHDDVSEGPFLSGDGVLGAAIAQRSVVSLSRLRPGFKLPYYVENHQPIGSVCAVPIFENEILRGVLVVDRVNAQAFSKEEEELLQATTRHAVRAIQNERIFIQLERAKVEQGKLYRAAESLGGASNEAGVVEAAVRSAREIAAFDFAAVTLFDRQEKTHEIRAVSGEGAEILLGARFAHNGGLVAMVVQNRHVLPYKGELEEKRQTVFAHRLPMPSMSSVLVLPLMVREQPLGTLVLGAKRRGVFGEAVRPTLEVLASHVAVSLANARMVRKLEEMATTDGMTGLVNKRALLELAADKMTAAIRFRRHLSVIVTDIDWFKKVNDTYGHDVGDMVIKGLGDILKRVKRATDSVARFGGEEFVVLCEETDSKGALLLAERIREEFAQTSFHTPKGTLQVTCSLGVATFPEAGKEWDTLFKSADNALYASKRGGRNRSTAWSHLVQRSSAA